MPYGPGAVANFSLLIPFVLFLSATIPQSLSKTEANGVGCPNAANLKTAIMMFLGWPLARRRRVGHDLAIL
jgi:hypothetical protein